MSGSSGSLATQELVLERFEVLVLQIPLRFQVQHALARREASSSVLVRAQGADGTCGFGECAPRPYVTGESETSVTGTLRDVLLPEFCGQSFATFADVTDGLQAGLGGLPRDRHAAFCALELAVLDLAGRHFRCSAGALLGPVVAPEARYSGVIAADDVAAVRASAELARKWQVTAVKVKTGAELDHNRSVLAAAREVLGPRVELRIDANGAWSSAEAIRQLRVLADFGLAACEQPVPAADHAGLAAVTAAGIVPVVADESLCSFDDAEELIARRACAMFNLRVSKHGGLLNTGRIHALARGAGIACQLGAQVGEAGFLSAAGRHVATRLAGLRWCEGSYGRILLEDDVVEPDLTVGPGGAAPALTGPGLGVIPRLAQLQRWARPG